MGLKLPYFASELEEANWWYDNRHLTEAEFLVAGAAGKLRTVVSRGSGNLRGDTIPAPAWDVPLQELAEARKLLEESGIWIEDGPNRLTNDPIKGRDARELRKAG